MVLLSEDKFKISLVRRELRELAQYSQRVYRISEQSSRAIFWRTGTIDSNEIFENRDNPVGRDFREPGQPSRTRLSRT